MQFFTKAGRVTWNQLKLQEQIAMLSMTIGPQRDIEWLIQRTLCFHKIGEITPQGLKLTRIGRRVMAERHGLPVVVGREPHGPHLATSIG